MDRVVVAVDPPKFDTESSDEAGIGVAGRAGNRLYVLEDLSDRLSPAGWGGKAVNAYLRRQADVLVGEVNNGGQMVGHTIHQVNPNVNFKIVTATRGKAKRAEPIVAIYEQHRAYHVGEFTELEDQLTTPIKELEHDDRMDWLVWAATELFPDEAERAFTFGSVDL
jgi:phage terminase large subunit-like protein